MVGGFDNPCALALLQYIFLDSYNFNDEI